MSSDIEQEIDEVFRQYERGEPATLYHRCSLPIVPSSFAFKADGKTDGDGTYVEHRRRRCNSCV